MPVIGGSHKPDLLTYCQYGEAEYELAGSPGGTTITFMAAGALNIGDAVYLSGQNATAYQSPNAAGGSTTAGYGSLTSPNLWFAPLVNKSTTANNYNGTSGSRIGVVVGGDAIYKNVQTGPNVVSLPTPACTAAGQLVYVMTDGVTWANADGAVATVGAYLIASTTTAGNVHPTTATTGANIGIALNTTGAAGPVLMLINLF